MQELRLFNLILEGDPS